MKEKNKKTQGNLSDLCLLFRNNFRNFDILNKQQLFKKILIFFWNPWKEMYAVILIACQIYCSNLLVALSNKKEKPINSRRDCLPIISPAVHYWNPNDALSRSTVTKLILACITRVFLDTHETRGACNHRILSVFAAFWRIIYIMWLCCF